MEACARSGNARRPFRNGSRDTLYLWWFYAAGTRTTDALKQSAKQRGNFIIDNAFATHPGFTIV